MADDLVPVEIFESGVYRTVSGAPVTFSDADLDEVVTNFAALRPKGIKPPLQLGHGEQQLIAQADGQPALGWVEDVKRVGSKLVGYVADMPAALKTLIKGRRYNRVSAGFNLAFQRSDDERNLKSGVTGKVLEHVALLGADLPQVKTLADLATFLASTGPLHASSPAPIDPADALIAEPEAAPLFAPAPSHAQVEPVSEPAKESPMADPKTDDVAALSQRLAALEAEKQERIAAEQAAAKERADMAATVASQAAELAALRASEASARQEARLSAAERFADSLCQPTCMRIAPAQKPWAAALHAHLSATTGTAIAKDAAERLQCAATGAGTDLTALALLEGFLNAAPDHKALLALVPRTKVTGAAALDGDDFDAALAHIAAREQLNLSNPQEQWKATQVLVAERPKFRASRAS